MAYTPTNWKNGDVVTSAKLNKLEQGVADAGVILFVNATVEDNAYTLDKTWQEIYDAMMAGVMPVIRKIAASAVAYTSIFSAMEEADAFVINDTQGMQYVAETANGYPSSDNK